MACDSTASKWPIDEVTQGLSVPNPNTPGAPIYRLDRDLLWTIFSINAQIDEYAFHEIGYVPDGKYSSYRLVVLLRSSQVCHAWRQILLSSPSLWARVIDIELFTQKEDWWRNEIIQRTGKCELFVHAGVHETRTGAGEATRFLMAILENEWDRICSLYIDTSKMEGIWPEVSRLLKRPTSCLRSFVFRVTSFRHNSEAGYGYVSADMRAVFSGVAPSLRYFKGTFISIDIRAPWICQIRSLQLNQLADKSPLGDIQKFTISELVDALSQMPLLEYLTILNCFKADTNPLSPHSSRPMNLPGLKKLYIKHNLQCCRALLDRIDIPLSTCSLRLEIDDSNLALDPQLPAADVQNYYIESWTSMHRIAAQYIKTFLDLHPVTRFGLSMSDHHTDFSHHAYPEHEFPDFYVGTLCEREGFAASLPVLIREFPSWRVHHITDFTFYFEDLYPSTARSEIMDIVRLIPNMKSLKTRPMGLHLLHSEFRHTPSSLSALKTVILLDLDVDHGFEISEVLLRFLRWRISMGVPIDTLDLTCLTGVSSWEKLSFLDEMAGLRVVWRTYYRDEGEHEYICGSGGPVAMYG